MEKKKIDLVITDLDDTIWDWLRMWYNSFNPYLNKIAEKFGIDIEELKKDFSRLHKKYGTSEVSYNYFELETLNDEQKTMMSVENGFGKSIIHQYNSDKKYNLSLYNGVRETLANLKEIGVKIIGFTESKSFYTAYRIKQLDLDGVFDVIYTPEDHGLPAQVKKYYDSGYWTLQKTIVKELSSDFKKPNPEILESIINNEYGKKDNTIYIGDKLDRDVFMAQSANVIGIYAKYGHIINNLEYELLRDVTHWSKEDVQREKDFKKSFKKREVIPEYILHDSFGEILSIFDFKSFTNGKSRKTNNC